MLELDFISLSKIETTRLLLHQLQTKDAADFFELRSNPSVIKYIGKEKFKTIDEATTLLQIIENGFNQNESITWGISLKENPNKVIGTIGFWRIIKPHFRAEIGYMLHPNFWQKGIMKEAINKVIEVGFSDLKLHSIEAHITPKNIASAKLLESCGFIREAYFKEDYFFNGQFLDSAIYSLINKIDK